ncbi:hypothetical protein BDR07DRAFT_1502848 [Suillus spraguei]|nr:hypothetical protein BDR07DRAFT_1502848 [Suillus spraguei]
MRLFWGGFALNGGSKGGRSFVVVSSFPHSRARPFIWFVRWNSCRRNSRATKSIWTGLNVLTPDPTGNEENRPAGLGSPQDSGGDEADSFLCRSTATDPEHHPRPVSPLPLGAASPHIIGSTGSDQTRSSQASTDYGGRPAWLRTLGI